MIFAPAPVEFHLRSCVHSQQIVARVNSDTEVQSTGMYLVVSGVSLSLLPPARLRLQQPSCSSRFPQLPTCSRCSFPFAARDVDGAGVESPALIGPSLDMALIQVALDRGAPALGGTLTVQFPGKSWAQRACSVPSVIFGRVLLFTVVRCVRRAGENSMKDTIEVAGEWEINLDLPGTVSPSPLRLTPDLADHCLES